MTDSQVNASLSLLKKQRSHVLLVLSNASAGRESDFLEWYRGRYRETVLGSSGMLGLQHYEQHAVDITQGRFPPLPFKYLGICELSIDGAEQAVALIEQISTLHRREAAAETPATWLYYPVSEKVGQSPTTRPPMLTLAFANAVAGQEREFREWYATRHIRHALKIPALASGQCFERTQWQMPGALTAKFSMIAMYEQEGTPESIIESFYALPPGALDFPMLEQDPLLFAEWVYRPI